MPISGTFFDQQDSHAGMTVAVQTERLVQGATPQSPEMGEKQLSANSQT
jgi:hypothetical protein